MPQKEHNMRVRGNAGDGQRKGKLCHESDFSDAGRWGCVQEHLSCTRAVNESPSTLFLSSFSPPLPRIRQSLQGPPFVDSYIILTFRVSALPSLNKQVA